MTVTSTSLDLAQFHDLGYAVIEDVFDPLTDFLPLRSGYSELLDREAARMLESGEISTYDRTMSFEQRFIQLVRQCEDLDWTPYDITFTLYGLNVSDSRPIYLGKPVFDMLRHPAILDLVEQIIGPEIYVNPVQHVRIKPPASGLRVTRKNSIVNEAQGWHQDLSVLKEDADYTDLITVWVAITDASEEMGCLKVVPESHRRDLLPHCPVDLLGPVIPDEYVTADLALPLPVKAGSVILMHRRTIHGSLQNVSERLRWSLDLRYQPTGQPTGRDIFPGFIARSRSDPAGELQDHQVWQQTWAEARDRLIDHDNSTLIRSWSADAPWCA